MNEKKTSRNKLNVRYRHETTEFTVVFDYNYKLQNMSVGLDEG